MGVWNVQPGSDWARQIVYEYEGLGMSIREIAREHHLHFASVRRLLLAEGVKLRPPHVVPNLQHAPSEYLARVVFLYREPPHGLGLSMRQVGQVVGRSRETVRGVLRRQGVQFRPRGGATKRDRWDGPLPTLRDS